MATCSSADSVLDAASLIKSNSAKLNTFVNGTSDQTVQLGTGDPTPVLRKFIADAQDVVTLAANDAAQTVVDTVSANASAVAALESGKADKMPSADAENLMCFDTAGNIDDSGRSVHDLAKLLSYANDTALTLAWKNGTSIKAYDESYAQHRFQIRLFGGTNPASSSKPVLFVISGQSNAVGVGNSPPSDQALDCGQFWSWYDGANALKPIKDPIGKSVRGSGWPAFARRFFALTGRKVILLNLAEGGAAVTDGGYTTENTWADNGYGTLRTSRTAIWNAFSTAVPASSYDLGGIIWIQGETEASRLYAGTVTVQDYKEGTLDVLDWTRSLIGDEDCPVFFGKIGFNSTSLSTPSLKVAFLAIQQAQDELCDGESLFMGFSMAPYFALPNNYGWWEYMSDDIHYSRKGYSILGSAFARSVVYSQNI